MTALRAATTHAAASETAAQFLRQALGAGLALTQPPAARWTGPDTDSDAMTRQLSREQQRAMFGEINLQRQRAEQAQSLRLSLTETGLEPESGTLAVALAKTLFTVKQTDLLSHLYHHGAASYDDLKAALPHIPYPHTVGGDLAHKGHVAKVKHPESGKAAFQLTPAGMDALAQHMGWTGAPPTDHPAGASDPEDTETGSHGGKAPNAGMHKVAGGTDKKPGEAFHYEPGAAPAPQSGPAAHSPTSSAALPLGWKLDKKKTGYKTKHQGTLAVVKPVGDKWQVATTDQQDFNVHPEKLATKEEGFAQAHKMLGLPPPTMLPKGWTKHGDSYTLDTGHKGLGAFVLDTHDGEFLAQAPTDLNHHTVDDPTEVFDNLPAAFAWSHQQLRVARMQRISRGDLPAPHHVTIAGKKVMLSPAPTTQADIDTAKASTDHNLSEKAKSALQDAWGGGKVQTHSDLHQALAIGEAANKTVSYSHLTAQSLQAGLDAGGIKA